MRLFLLILFMTMFSIEVIDSSTAFIRSSVSQNKPVFGEEDQRDSRSADGAQKSTHEDRVSTNCSSHFALVAQITGAATWSRESSIFTFPDILIPKAKQFISRIYRPPIV